METFGSRIQGLVILAMIALFIALAANTIAKTSRYEKQIVVEKTQNLPPPTVSAQAGTQAPQAP